MPEYILTLIQGKENSPPPPPCFLAFIKNESLKGKKKISGGDKNKEELKNCKLRKVTAIKPELKVQL